MQRDQETDPRIWSRAACEPDTVCCALPHVAAGMMEEQCCSGKGEVKGEGSLVGRVKDTAEDVTFVLNQEN